MRIAARQEENVARVQRDRRMSVPHDLARAVQNDVIDRFARRRFRMIQLERAGEQAAQIERAGKMRELNQSVESVHIRKPKRYFDTAPANSSAAAFLRVSESDTLAINARNHATSVDSSGCGSES